MQVNSGEQGSNALSAAFARVERLPLPTSVVADRKLSVMGYEDDPYVDCPYDDYSDYNDSRDE